MVREASIFSKLQVYENIHEGFSFSITLKANFRNNVLLQILTLVESCFIEIRALLPVILEKELPQVRFLDISKTNTLQRSILLQILLCKLFREKKETLAQVFSCEFCKIFKNTSGGYFYIAMLYLHSFLITMHEIDAAVQRCI